MEEINIRKLKPAAREQLRGVVIRLLERGHTQTLVAREFGIHRTTVNMWAREYAKEGHAALKDDKRPLCQGSCPVA